MLRNRRDGLFIITCLVANIFDVADFPNILKNIFVKLSIATPAVLASANHGWVYLTSNCKSSISSKILWFIQ